MAHHEISKDVDPVYCTPYKIGNGNGNIKALREYRPTSGPKACIPLHLSSDSTESPNLGSVPLVLHTKKFQNTAKPPIQ